jgi:hypothetical protein
LSLRHAGTSQEQKEHARNHTIHDPHKRALLSKSIQEEVTFFEEDIQPKASLAGEPKTGLTGVGETEVP